MTYPEHFRLTYGGSLLGVEQWTCSLKIAAGDMWNDYSAMRAFAADRLAEIHPKLLTYFKSTTSSFHRDCRLEWCKFVPIDQQGKYMTTGSTPEYIWSTPQTPGIHTSSQTAALPPQVALVVTLRSTTTTRGRGSHGRYYLPPATFALGNADPYFSSTVATQIATAAKDFIQSLNSWTNPPSGAPYVANIAKTGECIRVNRVTVGNYYDTHRSRRHALKETYSGVEW